MRLDKFICKSTELTRTEAKKLLKSGEVRVNGEIAKNAAMQVHENNTITIDGNILTARSSRYIMLHKVADTICSNVDEIYPSVLHYVEVDKAFDLHIAGRLDADTTGLVLLTDDGRWSHNVISPKKDCPKTYRVWLRNPISEEKYPELVAHFTQGIQLQGEANLTKPAILQLVNENETAQEVLLTITEGKYHQVKRMFAAVGNRVVGLHREQISSLTLGDLAPGEWRYLTAEEVALFS
ncbi:pseudouridine synthase [Colwellia sp. D2M02]|uniref:pseudouridine synthase n=1 Tax=Colwellia sp. D2M02 TaxID=2841562 RepID=UPI001C0945F7|nr:pseudouridine synthase [Colwellia sp. D2M02]MBU2892094.1 pseudouridine synthase [Colwellia sp. D2M02]